MGEKMAPSSQEEGRGDGSTRQAWIETTCRRGTRIIEDLTQTAVFILMIKRSPRLLNARGHRQELHSSPDSHSRLRQML